MVSGSFLVRLGSVNSILIVSGIVIMLEEGIAPSNAFIQRTVGVHVIARHGRSAGNPLSYSIRPCRDDEEIKAACEFFTGEFYGFEDKGTGQNKQLVKDNYRDFCKRYGETVGNRKVR